MIASIELENLVSFREPARQPYCGHCRLCAGVAHAHFVNARDSRTDQLRHLDFQWIWNAEACAFIRGLLHRIDDRLEGVAVNRWAPGPYVIDIRVAIDIVDVSPFRAFRKKWRSEERRVGK